MPSLDLPERVDVLVAGAGPAGSVAARHAALAGATVLAVDRRKQIGVPAMCAGYYPAPQVDGVVMPRSVAIAKVARARIFFDHAERPEVEAEDQGILMDRARFDRWLALRAIDAGALVRAGVRLVSLDGDRAELVSAAGSRHVRFGRLVAADGPHSQIRALLGLPALDLVRAIQVNVACSERRRGIEYHFFQEYPSGYAWVFYKGGTADVGIAGTEALAKRLLTQVLERLSGEARPLPVLSWLAAPIARYRPGMLRVHGRVAFAGEAVGAIDNVTWGGIRPAVLTGRHAGRWAGGLLDALEGVDGLRELDRELAAAALRRDEWEAAGTLVAASVASSWYSFNQAIVAV